MGLRDCLLVASWLVWGLAATGCNQVKSAENPTDDAMEAAPAVPPAESAAVGTATTADGWSFDDVAAGTTPTGWSPGETNGAGRPAIWTTVAQEDAPSSPNAYGVTASTNHGSTFNVALAGGTSHRDVDLTVAVLAVSGAEDQGGGPVWRAADADNYYISRWNPQEKNFSVYFVKDGRRKQLATAKATGDVTRWHTIRVVHVGDHIECSLDGEKLIEVDDETFPSAGQVGLWTKADAASLFDDLRVATPGSAP